ncbi:MAG: MFS transporter [Candidatus Njordarchaeota archaeon]
MVNRNLLSLSMTAIITSFCNSTFWTIIPLIMWDLGFSLTDIAIFYVAQSIPMLLFSRFFGILADRTGKKKFIIVELLINFFAFVLFYGFFVSGDIKIIHLALASSAVGFSWAVGGGAFVAAITTSLTREKTGRATGVYLSFDAIGWTIGSFVSGYTADYYGVEFIFMLAMILNLIGLLIIAGGYFDVISHAHTSFSIIKGAFRDSWTFRIMGRRIELFCLYAVVALLNLGGSIYFLAFVIKFYIIVGTKTMYGIITGLAGILGFLVPYFVGNISDKISKEKMLFYSLLIRIGFMAYMAFSWDYIAAIIFWLVPLWGIINLALIALTTDLSQEGYESEAQAIRNIVGFVSSTLGNIIGGIMSEIVNISRDLSMMYIILIIGCFFYLIGFIMSFVLLKRVQN